MNIAPKGRSHFDGTATRSQIHADRLALKGNFPGASTTVRRSWAMRPAPKPIPDRGTFCHYQNAPSEFCGARHIKDSRYCVGHARKLGELQPSADTETPEP